MRYKKEKLLLLFPTSPVHVNNFSLLFDKLPAWKFLGICFAPMQNKIPGIIDHFKSNHINYIEIENINSLSEKLTDNISVVIFGAAFDLFATELFLCVKERHIPVLAIEEVAQLSLNNMEINNYDLPFDILFLANHKEYRLFKEINYNESMLKVSGLLSSDYGLENKETFNHEEFKNRFNIPHDKKVLVYTTSPLRSRLAIHNKDDLNFRLSVLKKINAANIDEKWTCIIKLHPNENIDKERARIKEVIPNAIVLGREVTVDSLFFIADAVINRGNSQTALDAALIGCPTIILACGIRTIFHDDGGAYVLDDIDELPFFIKEIERGNTPDPGELKKNNLYIPPHGVSELIAKEIEKIADKPLSLSPNAWQWLIKTFLFHGNNETALQICRKISNKTKLIEAIEQTLTIEFEEYESSICAWENCKKIDPTWYFPYYELSNRHLSQGNFENAVKEAEKAIEAHAPYHYLWHEIPMRILQSNSLRSKNNILEAWKQLYPLMLTGSADMAPDFLIEKASLYFASDLHQECLNMLHKVTGILKDYPLSPLVDSVLYHKAGLIYKDIGKNENALECFAKAILINPNDPWPHFELGNLLVRKADDDAAEKEFREAIRIDPSIPWPHLELGNLLARKADDDSAEKEFREAIRIDPSIPWTHLELGNLLARKADDDAAEIEFRESIRHKPSYILSHYNLFILLLKRGKIKECFTALIYMIPYLLQKMRKNLIEKLN